MYQRLMYAIKRRILDESQDAFAGHPAFSQKVRVYNKFPYEERVQYGLVLRNTSASQIRLSADNFMSDLYSLVRIARQGDHPGIAIEWVRENAGWITQYVTEDVSSQLGPTQRQFYTSQQILLGPDNTLFADNPGQVVVTIDGVPIVAEEVDGEEKRVLLLRATSSSEKVEISYYRRNIIAPSINVVEFVTDNHFIIGTIYVIEEEILISRTTGTETTAQLAYGGVGTNTIDVNSEDIYTAYADGTRIFTLEKGTHYSIDYNTGLVTFLLPLQKNYRIYANYRYQEAGFSGPFVFEPFQDVSDAIPGVVISIGRRAQQGDKQAIMVSQIREQQAKIYGGHWDMSLELAVISKDPSQMEQMTDHIISYLWAKRKNVLEYEGIALNSVEPTGETEEVHIDVTGDLYYESSVSISVQSEWQRFSPYNPIYQLRGISVLPEMRDVLKAPVLGFEKLT